MNHQRRLQGMCIETDFTIIVQVNSSYSIQHDIFTNEVNQGTYHVNCISTNEPCIVCSIVLKSHHLCLHHIYNREDPVE